MKKIKSSLVIILIIISGSLVGNVSIYYDIVFFSGLVFLLGVMTYFMKKAESNLAKVVEEGTLEELQDCLKEIEESKDMDDKTRLNLIKEINSKIEIKHRTNGSN